jgi:hypothetical protein
MSRQVPHAEDIATGTPTLGQVPVSAGPGLAPAWGAAGGGGGGGSYVYVGRQTVTGSPATLIEFTPIPTGAADLVFRGKVKYSVATTNSGHEISMRFNADDGSDYNYSRHRHGRVNSINVHDWSVCDGGTFEDHVGIGRAPGSDSQAWDVATFEVTLPNYDENDGFAKTYYGRSFFSYHLGDTQVGYDTHGTWAGGFGPTALGPITRVTFGITGVTDPFAVGSYVDMWKILPS